MEPDNACPCKPDDAVCLALWKGDASTDGDRIIEGLASIDCRDTEGEIVHPDKLDLSYLTKSGKVNWSHGSDPGDQLGHIVSYRVGLVKDIVPKKYHDRVRKFLNHTGLWIKAKLKQGLRKAEDVWKDMSSNPTDHGLGFSLQGSATQREGHNVVGAFVTNVSITPNPVLTETFAVLSKALGTSYSRSDQTGLQAAVPEDIRSQVISTAVGSSVYGSNPPGGWGMRGESVSGHRITRDENNRPIRQAVTSSALMPRGLPIQLPLDTPAAARAVKSFLRHVREIGPERGNVLDGSASYFEVIHGLDSATARALAKYVRENADKLFRKCFPSLGAVTEEKQMSGSAIDALEKAINSITIDGSPETPAAADAEPKQDAALNKSKDKEPAAGEGAEAATDCGNCGYDRLTKGCTTCPQCGKSTMAKSHAAAADAVAAGDGADDVVDVTPLLQKLEKSVTTSERADNVLAKSVLHVVQANQSLAKLVKSQQEEISNLRKEVADRDGKMSKSLDAICEKMQIVAAVPNPRKSDDSLEKSKTSAADPSAEAEAAIDAEYNTFLYAGLVPPIRARMVDSKSLSKAHVIHEIKLQQQMSQSINRARGPVPLNNGHW